MSRLFSLGFVASSLVGALWALSSDPPVPARSLAAEAELRWYRGNLHTHSHWSDGNDYLEMIAVWYDEHDYDFLVFTDHNVLANTERWVAVDETKGGRTAYDKLKARFPDWIEERQQDGQLEVRLRTFAEVSDQLARPGEYLLIQGEEISDRFENLPIHLNASNIDEVITPRGGDSVLEVMQNNVDAVIAQRERTGQPILVHLNHPNFGHAITAEDLMRVVGENFFEVYNGHPAVYNAGDHVHASTDRIWDIVLTFRLAELGLPLMYGLAVDDGHEYHDLPSRGSNPGRGWVYVLAAELTPDALIDALEGGRFYASSGVRLKQVESSSRGLALEVEAEEGVEYEIEFIGTRQSFDDSSEDVLDEEENVLRTTRRYSDDVGAVLKTVKGASAAYEFAGSELYVRARITSTKRHPNPSEPGEFERAWCQPIRGPAAPAAEEGE
jgi:hypothetical protein